MPALLCAKCHQCISGDDGDHQTWDAKTYCLECLDESGIAEFIGQPLEETVHFTLGSAFVRGIWSYVYTTTLMTSILLGLFFLIQIAVLLSGQKRGDLLTFIGMHAYFGCFTFLFVSVVSIPLNLLTAVFRRDRSFSVRDGQLIIETSFSTESLPLSCCRWEARLMGRDRFGVYFPRTPVIEILEDGSHELVVLGFSDQSRRLWSAYFRLLALPQVESSDRWESIRSALRLVATGGMLGAVSGYLAHLMTGDPGWIAAGAMCGFLDGLIAFLVYKSINRCQDRYAAKQFHPALAALLFGFTGMKVGVFAGRIGVIWCGCLNAIIGLVIGLHVRMLVRKLEEKQPKGTEHLVDDWI